jgi:hypothetical protein
MLRRRDGQLRIVAEMFVIDSGVKSPESIDCLAALSKRAAQS